MVYLWIIHADVLFKGFLEDLVSVEVVVIRVEEVVVDDEGVHGTADEGHVSLEQGGFLAAIATDGALLMDQGIGIIVGVFSRPIGSGASPSARGNTTVVVVIVGVAFGIVIFQFSLELKGFSEIYKEFIAEFVKPLLPLNHTMDSRGQVVEIWLEDDPVFILAHSVAPAES